MRLPAIFLLLTIFFISCKKETAFLACTNNCKSFSLQGRAYDGTANLGLADTDLRLRWEHFGNSCLFCPGDKNDIYAGKTDASGNFKFTITVDTSRFVNSYLNLITPQKANYYNSFVSSVNDSNLNLLPINIVYYPTTTLTLKLFQVQNDVLKFVSIFHEWKQVSGQLTFVADYYGTRPIVGGDTTIKIITAADIPTIVRVDKRFPDNSFIDIKDSIICKKNQNNSLSMYY